MESTKPQLSIDEKSDVERIRNSSLKVLLEKKGIEPNFDDLLGVGSFTAVFAAMDRGIPRAIRISRRFDESARKEFERGRNLWPVTKHHNALLTQYWGEVIECDKVGGAFLCTIWEKATKSLDKHEICGLDEASRFLKSIADAIDHLHREKPIPVMHRDIKPANIMLVESSDGTLNAMLGDLGCARLADAADATLNIGTPEYRHNLQILGKVERFRQCDVYSFALVCLDTIWRAQNPGKTRKSFFLMDESEMRSFVTDLLLEGPKSSKVGDIVCSKDLQFDCRAGDVVNILFSSSNETSKPSSVSEFQVIEDDYNARALDPKRLESLGLTDKTLGRIVSRSIGAPRNHLPELLRNQTKLFGAFRAKQLAYELTRFVEQTRTASLGICRLAADPGPADTIRIYRSELAQITSVRNSLEQILTSRLDWTNYTDMVSNLFGHVDEADAGFTKIQLGDRPSNRDIDFPKYENSRLENEPEKIRHLELTARRLIESMAQAEDSIREFYEDHCSLLNGE